MSIWDIMGQPGLLNLLSDSYFTGAHGILAVADFTRKATLDRLEPWIRNVRQVAGAVPVLVAVNKVDLAGDGERGAPEVVEVATRYANGYVATSAKTGENVEAAFHQLAALVARRQLQRA
jgi:GTPase SAR1 family protein